MALTLATAMRNAIADAVDATINAGGGAGYLEFQTAGDAEVATITFETTAFDAGGTAGAGIITMQSQPKSDTNATGNASAMAKFKIYDNGAPGELLITGTVSTTGADINFPGGLVVGAGDTVTLTTFTITCPAS